MNAIHFSSSCIVSLAAQRHLNQTIGESSPTPLTDDSESMQGNQTLHSFFPGRNSLNKFAKFYTRLRDE
jgi:hypothetical protein